MSAKILAWISSALFAVTLLVSIGGFIYLIRQQREMMGAFRADELLMTNVELIALEAVEAGNVPKAHATMIQQISSWPNAPPAESRATKRASA